MTAITLVAKKSSISSREPVFFDKALENASIVIDNAAYLATKDRLYDVKGMGKGWAQFRNVGADSIDMLIEKTHKEFTDISTLTEVDFEESVAEAAIAAGVSATGTVDVTGGPNVVANGTLTLVSAVALTKATGTITCATVLENTFATGTITLAAAEVGDTVTVNGLVYTAISGSKAGDFTKFDIDGDNTVDAADLADSIQNDTRSGTSGDQTATSTTDVVTVTIDVAGTAGNAITLVSSNGTRLAVSGSGTFTGGVDADTVTVNGLVYTAVAGARTNDTEFSTDTGDNETALDLAAAITADVRAGTLNDVTATSTTNVVTCTQTVGGTGGNATTLTSTDGVTLAVSGATFTGGLEADTVTVNGLVYIAVAGAKANDTQFSIDASDNAAATDLADSIDDDVRPGTTVPTIDVTATATTNVVTVVAPLNDGAAGNAIDIAGTANITADNATLTGGVDSSMDGITVDDIEIMSGPVPFRTNSTLTADDVAANITANTSIPNYTAAAVAGLITITKVEQEASTFVVVSSTTVLTTTDANFSGGSSGKSVAFSNVAISPEITALKFRFKETAGGSSGAVKSEMGFIR